MIDSFSKIAIYTKPNCVYCRKAKKLLDTNHIPYLEHKLDVNFTREYVVSMFPEAKTYPIIVLDGFNIGGAKELEEMLIEQHKDTTQLLNEDKYEV